MIRKLINAEASAQPGGSPDRVRLPTLLRCQVRVRLHSYIQVWGGCSQAMLSSGLKILCNPSLKNLRASLLCAALSGPSVCRVIIKHRAGPAQRQTVKCKDLFLRHHCHRLAHIWKPDFQVLPVLQSTLSLYSSSTFLLASPHVPWVLCFISTECTLG